MTPNQEAHAAQATPTTATPTQSDTPSGDPHGGQTRTVQMRQLHATALVLLNAQTQDQLPQRVWQRLRDYFNGTVIEVHMDTPDELIRIEMDWVLGQREGNHFKCNLSTWHEGQYYSVPMSFKAELDVDELLDHWPEHRPRPDGESAQGTDRGAGQGEDSNTDNSKP